MRLLIWQWGRFGAGPRYAAALAAALRKSGMDVDLSLTRGAELLQGTDPPPVALPVRGYAGMGGFVWRLATMPARIGPLARRLRRLRSDFALCAMPAMLDMLMAAALQRAGVPYAVVVHDATPHPGECAPLQHRLQARLLRRAALLVTLSAHVAAELRARGLDGGLPIVTIELPPLRYGPVTTPAAHGGPCRLLCFGRLLPYKGLDLLAAAMSGLPPCQLRVVGRGPDSATLAQLRALPGVQVENRWVPEGEIADLLAWADWVVLPYREASQSGVAAAALAAGRGVIATRVGGLPAQLAGEPAAILCDPDATSLAQALQAAIAQPVPCAASRPDAWAAMAGQLRTMLVRFSARRHRGSGVSH